MLDVDFVLIDEISLVSQDLRGVVNIRCRTAMQGQQGMSRQDRNALCRSLSVILVGNSTKLSPGGGAPMWWDGPTTRGHSLEGRRAWLSLNAWVELTQVMRQLNPEQEGFRNTLVHTAEGNSTREGKYLLSTMR